MLSPKRVGRHPSAGTFYYWSLVMVFVSMTALSILRWPHDNHLLTLGILSFGAGYIGRAARRHLWTGWPRIDMSGMGLSYILLLTAFYVDNGPSLPVWKLLPSWSVLAGAESVRVADSILGAAPAPVGSKGQQYRRPWRRLTGVAAGRRTLSVRQPQEGAVENGWIGRHGRCSSSVAMVYHSVDYRQSQWRLDGHDHLMSPWKYRSSLSRSRAALRQATSSSRLSAAPGSPASSPSETRRTSCRPATTTSPTSCVCSSPTS